MTPKCGLLTISCELRTYFAIRDPEFRVEGGPLPVPRASRKCSVAYGIYLAWQEYSSRRKAGVMFSARSVRIGLICGALAICFAISGKAQDGGQPQEAARPNGSNSQRQDKNQDKCCASAEHQTKTAEEQTAP